MALTVNADDFGLSASVNEAICLAFSKGLIDRTTLMVNMPAAADAMHMAEQGGFIDRIGLHLNLTSGRPLTENIASDPVMCGKNGEFTADFARNTKTRFFFPKRTRQNVEEEIRAQLDMYRKLGGVLWHIDSHHYVHTDPSVWLILKRVLRDYPVTSVRLGRNMYTGGNPLLHVYKTILNASIRKYCKGSPAYFGSAEDYREFIKSHPGISERFDTEVMVHPVFDGQGRLADEFEGKYYEMERL